MEKIIIITKKQKEKILEIINSLEKSGNCELVSVECWKDCPLSVNNNRTGLDCTNYATKNVENMGSKVFYG